MHGGGGVDGDDKFKGPKWEATLRGFSFVIMVACSGFVFPLYCELVSLSGFAGCSVVPAVRWLFVVCSWLFSGCSVAVRRLFAVVRGCSVLLAIHSSWLFAFGLRFLVQDFSWFVICEISHTAGGFIPRYLGVSPKVYL
ncbi:hypothetical protein U1Q18_010661 [Sarracenia purpurea var. burkii]